MVGGVAGGVTIVGVGPIETAGLVGKEGADGTIEVVGGIAWG